MTSPNPSGSIPVVALPPSEARPVWGNWRQRIGFLLAGVYVWTLLIYQLQPEWRLNPHYAYGWAVPFLTAYLFWESWPRRNDPAPGQRGAGRLALGTAAALLLFLLPLRLVMEANADWRLLSWALAATVVALTFVPLYVCGGWPWVRSFAFPLGFFLVAVPWPTWVEHRLIQGLTRANAEITLEWLTWWGIPALRRGNLIELTTGVVGIDEACSGIRSFQGTLMIALFMGAFYHLSSMRRIALVGIGAAVAFGCNVVRTFFLVRVAARDGVAAIATWHDSAGTAILLVSLLLLWLVALYLARNGRILEPIRRAPAGAVISVRPVWGWVVFGWLAACEGATQAWYVAHERRAPPPQEWRVAWPEASPSFRFLPIADGVRQILRYDEGLRASWRQGDETQWQLFYFRWRPGRTASTLARNHTPDICLPAAGRTITAAGAPWVASMAAVPLKFKSYTFEFEGRPVFVFYSLWEDREVLQDVAPTTLTRQRRLAAVREGRRNRGQRVLQVAMVGYANLASAEDRLRRELPGLIKLK